MFEWFEKYRISLAIVLALIVVIIGLGVGVKSCLSLKTDAAPKAAVAVPGEVRISTVTTESALDLQDAFIKVSDAVGPAVVSIVTETTHRIPARQYRFGPPEGFFDKEFEEFFKDFFGEIPEREFKQQGLGSGVIVDEEGYIITNDHVIGGAGKITAILPDGRKLDAQVKGSDQRSDLAVIKIDAENLPVAKLGNSDAVRTGQWVVAIGNPFGFVVNNPKPTVTVGVVSALHRSLPMGSAQGRSYMDLIQTDAAINPGNSGGPLCDLDGSIIGINVAIYSTTGGYQGIGFAIPINSVKHVLDDLIEGRKVVYGWLGVTIQELSYDMAEYFNIKDREGAIVTEVMKNGPAEKGGVKSGDIIRTFNGEKVDSLRTMLKLAGEAKVGEKARLGILRDGKEMALDVVIGERPSEEAIARGELKKEAPAEIPEAEKWRGMAVTEITDEISQRYRVEKQPGVLILGVENGSPADIAGLRRGLVIKEINKKIIRNLKDYNEAVQKAKGKTLIRTNLGYTIVKEESP